jgi:hypothetical protein
VVTKQGCNIVWKYPSSELSSGVYQRNHAQRYASFISTVRDWKAYRRIPQREVLTPISSHAPRRLRPGDIPLIVAMQNNHVLLPSFLVHYRRLGVTRFLVVDDHSTDGTYEILLSQPDVDLYRPSLSYAQALRGKLWREAVVRRYGRHRWYVNVDADEYLVYDRYQSCSLREVIDRMRMLGINRLVAPMIDLYPDGTIESAEFADLADRMPWEAAPLFDADGYSFEVGPRTMRIRGGVVRRAFAADIELIKFPIIYWDTLTVLARSIHYPLPYWRNFGLIGGALLHFRFVPGFTYKVTEAVATGQYAGHSKFHKDVLKSNFDLSDASLRGRCSVRFEGDRQLSDLGFFARLFDQ